MRTLVFRKLRIKCVCFSVSYMMGHFAFSFCTKARVYYSLESKTDRELKKFPWSEFKLTVSDVYPDKHYYYHNGEKLAIVGFDYGVDHKTGSHYKTAVRPKDLLAEKQQQLEKAIEDNSIYLVKEEEILQFLLLW